MDTGASLASVLDGLTAALDEAEALALWCYPADEVRRWACGLQGVRARAEALACRAVVAAGTAGVAEREGQRSVPAVIAAHTGANPKAIATDARLGTWLGDYPIIEEAFAAGRISRRHVEALRRVENPRTRHHLGEAQQYLVAAAVGCQWHEFIQVLRYWELAFDPDGVEPDAQAESRSCRVGKNPDGTVTGRFHLDPIAGQAFMTALEQEEQRLFREESESVTGISRTAAQRRADAFVNLICRGAARPDGTTPAPLVHVVLGEEVVSGPGPVGAGRLSSPGTTRPQPDPRPGAHRADLSSGPQSRTVGGRPGPVPGVGL